MSLETVLQMVLGFTIIGFGFKNVLAVFFNFVKVFQEIEKKLFIRQKRKNNIFMTLMKIDKRKLVIN